MALISIDSKFMKFVDRLVDVLGLNLLWLICCLPLVTIGAATSAAFSVTLQMVDDREGGVLRPFFAAFRANFRRATVLWALHCFALYALFIDSQLLSFGEPSLLLLIASIVSAVFVFCAFLYAYPLLARYDSGVKVALQNSLKISFQYWGRTLLMIAVLVLELAVFAWNTTMMFIGVLVGPMILIYTIAGMAKRIFERIDSQVPEHPTS